MCAPNNDLCTVLAAYMTCVPDPQDVASRRRRSFSSPVVPYTMLIFSKILVARPLPPPLPLLKKRFLRIPLDNVKLGVKLMNISSYVLHVIKDPDLLECGLVLYFFIYLGNF